MKIIFSLVALICTPELSYAQPGCESVGASMESSLFSAIQKDLKIDASAVQKEKTAVEIINIAPVSKLYAESLAKQDYLVDKAKNRELTLKESDYFSSYYENQTKSFTAKYTYINKSNKKDVFIASSLMNEDECSIRFNGYLTLSREF
uniref:Shiga toxin A subunit n=1 Tax=Scandinavium goeteborgense TaxID=1851514 RepID=UPI00135851D2